MTFGTKFDCGRVIKTLCLFANILTFTKGSFSVRAMESSNSYLIKLLEVLSYSIFFSYFWKFVMSAWLYGQWVISPWVNCKINLRIQCQSFSSPYNLIPAIFRVLTGWHLTFCSPTWPTCCNSARNIRRGKKLSFQWSHRQPIVDETLESFMPCELDNAFQKQLPRSVLIKKCS